MARDVEVNVTASDKTGPGLKSSENSFSKTQKRIEDEQKKSNRKIEDEQKKHAEKLSDVLGKGLSDGLEKIAPNFSKQLGGAFTAASDYAAPLLAGGIAAASPLLAATVSAAIAGGISVGVAGIGVALVSQDARVQAAGHELGQHFMDALHQDASPFIGPVLDGIDTIERKFDELQPEIRNIFRNSAGFVQPLVDGATEGAASIVRGVDKLVGKSQPVVDALGRSLSNLGDDFGTLIGNVDTSGAVAAIDDLTDAVGNLLDVVGPTINVLSKLYGWASKIGLVKDVATSLLGPLGQLAPFLDSADGKFRAVSKSTDDASASFEQATDDTTDYAAGLQQANQAVAELYQSQRDLYSANTSVAQAFADASKAAKKNGDTLSLNTQKGRDNRDALSNVAEALQRDYDGYVKVNGAGSGAASLASTLRSRFITLAEKMGASAKQAQSLANKMLGIPNVNRHVSVQTAAAQAAAQALKNKLAGIKDRTVYVNVALNQGRLNKVENTLSRLGGQGFAAGDGFAFGSNGSRVGGPAGPINLESTVLVQLDGQPFRAATAAAIRSNNQQQKWRQRSGVRA